MSESNGKLTNPDEMFGVPAKRRYITITLPVSGYHLRIQSITESEYSAYQAASWTKKGDALRPDRLKDSNRRFIAMCLVDSEGNRYLSNKDSTNLSEWDAGDTAYLYSECASHCKINSEDIEESVKNLEETLDAS